MIDVMIKSPSYFLFMKKIYVKKINEKYKMAKKLYFNNINQYQKEDGYKMNLDIHVPSIQK